MWVLESKALQVFLCRYVGILVTRDVFCIVIFHSIRKPGLVIITSINYYITSYSVNICPSYSLF